MASVTTSIRTPGRPKPRHARSFPFDAVGAIALAWAAAFLALAFLLA
jgi:hypothetical protein